MDVGFMKEGDGWVDLMIAVRPGSDSDAWLDVKGGWLRVKIQEQPRKGRANEALRRFLSRSLGVDRGKVEILSGERSRKKRVRIWADPRKIVEALPKASGPIVDRPA